MKRHLTRAGAAGAASAAMLCSMLASAASASTTAERPKVVVLAQVNASTTHRTFGGGATDGGAAGRAFAAAIKGEGFDLVRAGERGSAAAGDLPIDDRGAAALASQVHAGIALVAGIQVRDDGRIRGTGLVGARATVTARVIDVASGVAVITEATSAAGWGTSGSDAAERAAAAAAARVMHAVTRRMSTRWPRVAPASQHVEVSIHGAVGWPSVLALVKHLQTSPGIPAAELIRLDRGRLVLAVRTQLPASRVARAASGAVLPLGRLSARSSGDGVRIDLIDQGTTP